MAMAFQQRQGQKQAITPAMMVELSLLSLPIGELREAVKKEIDSNPALEIETPRFSSYSSRRSDSPSAGDLIDTVAAEGGVTLEEHLMSELRMAGVEGRELELCRAIVAEIDGEVFYGEAAGWGVLEVLEYAEAVEALVAGMDEAVAALEVTPQGLPELVCGELLAQEGREGCLDVGVIEGWEEVIRSFYGAIALGGIEWVALVH
mgnify:CR=1 FL=1